MELRIAPHKLYRRDGDDIHIELPVTLGEAVLSGRVNVPTPSGTVAMTVPAGSIPAASCACAARAMKRADGSGGDEYVTLKVVLPDGANAELADFLREWTGKHPYDPRGGLEGL